MVKFGLSVLMMFFLAGVVQAQEVRPPNVLLIFADDISYGDLSSYGQKHFQTPHLDKLVSEGMRFHRAYAGSPECASSRASLMTGQHMGHCRIRANRSARGQEHLLAEDVTLAEMLKGAGYRTAFIGKWGMGLPGTEGVPHEQGFDLAYGFYDQLRAHTFFPEYMMRNGVQEPLPGNVGFNMSRVRQRWRGGAFENTYDAHGQLVPDGVADPSQAVYSEHLFVAEACQFIAEANDSPFFIYYATQLPHGPCITPDISQFMEKDWSPAHKEWAAMVEHLDASVGQMVAAIEAAGQLDNTLILFAGTTVTACGAMCRVLAAGIKMRCFKTKGRGPRASFPLRMKGACGCLFLPGGPVACQRVNATTFWRCMT